MHKMFPRLKETDFPRIRRKPLHTLQINTGYKCNQACLHCHVNASPKRTEVMSQDIIQLAISYLQTGAVSTLDITGGAPELNPYFRELVLGARENGIHVMDRCNLTILEEPGQENLGNFLADNEVEIIASLPCYLEENVEKQRGEGIFKTSIQALKQLNKLGYGQPDSGFILNLVYNPTGPYLPPAQIQLEADYKRELSSRYGVVFNQLLTITNMPIARFGSTLVSQGEFDRYMNLLHQSHCSENIADVMCRTLVSVDYQGYVYDCDFNQMLGIPLNFGNKPRIHLKNLLDISLEGNSIAVANHCYGCTAGQGSSCTGALSVD